MNSQLTLNDVEALERRTLEWYDSRAKNDAADAQAAEEIERVRAEHSRGGIKLVTDDVLAGYEETWRKNFDRETLTSGLALETDIDVADARFAGRIAASEPLKSPAEMYGTTTDRYLLARIVDELEGTRVRGEFAGLTRQQLVDIYPKWQDDSDNPRVRVLEDAVLAGTLLKLGVRDDPNTDAKAVMRLRDLVTERRRKRVEPWLFEARERLQRIKSRQLAFTMQHLRSGRGIAHRPAPKQVRIGAGAAS